MQSQHIAIPVISFRTLRKTTGVQRKITTFSIRFVREISKQFLRIFTKYFLHKIMPLGFAFIS